MDSAGPMLDFISKNRAKHISASNESVAEADKFTLSDLGTEDSEDVGDFALSSLLQDESVSCSSASDNQLNGKAAFQPAVESISGAGVVADRPDSDVISDGSSDLSHKADSFFSGQSTFFRFAFFA